MSNIPEPVCPRHPDRVSHLTCRRCGRPACPDCQHASSTWFDCVDCVDGGAVDDVPPRQNRAAGAALRVEDSPWAGDPRFAGPEHGVTGAPDGGNRDAVPHERGVDGALAEGATPQTAGDLTGGGDMAGGVPTGSHTGAHPTAGHGPRDRGTHRPQPVITYGLIGLCVAVYLWQRIDPSVTDLGDFSAVSGYLEPWRFLTAAFLHSPDTMSHLLFNMLSLYTMGQFLEPVLGRARFLALYLLSAFGGSVGCLLLVPTLDASDQSSLMAWVQGMVGASGAVFGLFTAAFFVLRRVGASVAGMVVLLGINLALPLFYPNIAWQAHVGGAVIGLVTAGLLYATARPGRERATWPILAALAVALAVAGWAKYALNATVLNHIASQVGTAIG